MDQPHALISLLVVACTLGCSVEEPEGPQVSWADEILVAPGHTGETFRDAALATNGARGGGWTAGGVDVFSLGLTVGVDDELVLGWTGRVVVDEPGVDLVVFENPFEVVGGGWYVDPVVVEVSPDGERWVAFPHDYVATDELAWSADPADWPGFAGLTPVLLHEEENPVDPFSEEAGGDGFDLAELPGPVGDEVRAAGAVAVRLTSAAVHENPDSGAVYPRDPVSNGADIDAVYARTLR